MWNPLFVTQPLLSKFRRLSRPEEAIAFELVLS